MKISKSHRGNIEFVGDVISKPIEYSSRTECSYCCGSGWKIQLVQPCDKCNGTGK